MSERAFVALGSNLGDRAAYLAAARSALSLLPTSRLAAASIVEETVPFGPAAQGPYLNQMVVMETSLPPTVLLGALQRIEWSLGRVRRERWGARTIDLDLVRMDGIEMRSATLVLPHPGWPSRDFWRRELAELETLLGDAA
ncbi:MAG: 2-amino-4-hydroxy-6-hydroxymethyldihydropteridine diphosphokinase [Gemmatimonadota bacterium]|nr:2-amino-4-hydroxy-6-hydroxymethyldihydropteridine diphosphokinase [Gemmatimonadota bacterium]